MCHSASPRALIARGGRRGKSRAPGARTPRAWTARGRRRALRGALLSATLLAACAPAAGPRTASAPPAAPDAVVATIPLGDFGTSVALTPDGKRAYVAATAKIFVLDTESRTLAATIVTGDMPYALAMSRDGSRLYAVDLLQQAVWFLDATSGAVLRRVALGAPRRPVLRPGIAVSPDGATVYATVSEPPGAGADLLYAIDSATGAKTQRALPFHPGPLVADAAGDTLWIVGCVGACSAGTLYGVRPSDPRRDAAAIPLASVAGGIALAPGGERAWVATSLAGSVAAVDLARRAVAAEVRVGADPLGIAPSPDGRAVYVTSFQANTLSAIDAATDAVIATVRLDRTPRAIAVTPDGRYAWVTHSTPEISVVDLSRVAPASGFAFRAPARVPRSPGGHG